MAKPLFRRATVTRIVKETPDTRTYVLEPHDGPFFYRAGQFCTFKILVDGRDLLRSYSMSSAPETDTEFTTTIKRVPGGKVSTWMHDNLTEGDVVELSPPTGRFLLRPALGPMLGFSGGSGITPIMSLTKSVLASTDRTVRLLCADRDRTSAIFESALAELTDRYPGRLTVIRHFDDERGFVTAATVREFVGADTGTDSYVCGPDPFMELVESALTGPGRVFSERFDTGTLSPPPARVDAPTTTPADTPAAPEKGTVTIVLGRKKRSVPRHNGETLLESARRAGLDPPFSCESGNCATCMAKLTEGKVTMRVNDALTDDEVADGYVLTCQAVPDTPSVTVDYEA